MKRLFLAFSLLLLSACNAQSTTAVNVKSNGAGTVAVSATLDKEAASTLPTDTAFFGTDQLKASGWKINGPTKKKNGDLVVSVSHAFADEGEAQTLLRTVAEPFGALIVSITKNPLWVSAKVSGAVDTTKGLPAYLPDGVTNDGLDRESLQKYFKEPIDDAVVVRMQLNVDGSKDSVQIPLGKQTAVSLSAWKVQTAVWYLLLAVAFVVIALYIARDRIRGRYGTKT